MIDKYHDIEPLIDLIADDYRMLQMISRFGITLGFGEQTVAVACKKAGVDVTTFLIVANYMKNPTTHISDEVIESVQLPALITYLKNSHSYFVDYRLPQIRRKLISAIDCSGQNQIAFLILKFFDEYAQEVAAHMHFENQNVHPHVELLLQGKLPAESIVSISRQHEANHTNIERSLGELKNIIIKYYPSDATSNLLSDALMDIYMMEEDLLSHCTLEDTLFAQCVEHLENDVRKRGGQPAEVADEPQEHTTTNDLSEREKEVIRLVAMGLSNKEIAEKMFIAVNTVMTHRRNINRKTGIHAAAGLTIYAIVNNIISVDEVKL